MENKLTIGAIPLLVTVIAVANSGYEVGYLKGEAKEVVLTVKAIPQFNVEAEIIRLKEAARVRLGHIHNHHAEEPHHG